MGLPFSRRRKEVDLNDELAAHLRLAIEDRVNAGEDPRHAERAARREFGSMAAVREQTRDAWGWMWLERLVQDTRYATRLAIREETVSVTIVVSLAIGIGANAALVSVCESLLGWKLPVDTPERLVTSDASISWKFLKILQAETGIFADVAGIALLDRYNVIIGTNTQAPTAGMRVALVSGNYFATLGVRAFRGRTITMDYDRIPGSHPIALISYERWKRGGAQDLTGATIRISDAVFTIVGVAPPDFSGD